MLLEESLAAAVILSGVTFDNVWLFLLGAALLLFVLILGLRRRAPKRPAQAPRLVRSPNNPLISPDPDHPWENEATFNPAAVCVDGRIHLFYRALGSDGVSRIGHCSSGDGIHFDDRLPYPAFIPDIAAQSHLHAPFTSPARFAYDRDRYASGGGWGGSEDPRAVVIDDTVHMTFSSFNGWDSIRMTHSSLHVDHLKARRWNWSRPRFLSPQGQRHKNWVVFPEKIRGKYAVVHSVGPLRIEFLDSLDELNDGGRFSGKHDHGGSGYRDPSRAHHWDNIVRGAGAPPVLTEEGWLLFYQALSPSDRSRYNIGVMLLDRNDPTTILYRSALPVLEPVMHYENDWKPGIVYASGAVVKDGELFVYYGGGDKTVNVATAPLARFLSELMQPEHKA
ncbi:MAG TPA: hypothetical protein VF803_02860 [Candidatus Paceibacterota bacterium]